eukprot:860032_1
MGHVPLEGEIVTGMTGWLLAEAPFLPADAPPITCLVAPVSADHDDLLGACSVTRTFGQLLPELRIDFSQLREQAESLSEFIHEILRQQMGWIPDEEPPPDDISWNTSPGKPHS